MRIDPYVLVGGAGIEPAEPKHLIYSQARCPLRNTHRYVTRLQYMFFNKGKEIITICCWSLCMAPPTGFEPATPSGHRFQVGFLTTRTDGICNWQAPKDSNPDQLGWSQSCYHYTRDLYVWRRRRDSNADSLATGHLSRVVRYHYSTPTYM